MKILIFSDVHGNLPAFEEMIKNEPGVESYICLGDLVNYGPWSNECVSLAKSLKNAILLIGNHEVDFLLGNYSGNNHIAKLFFEFCYPKFNHISAFSSFLESYNFNGYILKHNLAFDVIYPDSEISLDNNYIIGHSHYQFMIKKNGFTLYNTGSVGQNRRYINVIDYLVFYPDKKYFELKNIRYNVEPVIQKMKNMGYPYDCIEYYNEKPRI